MNKQEFNEYKQKEMFKDGVKLGPSMILSKSLERPMYAKHVGNENVLVIGGAGSGKTKSVIIPNLLQMTGSYVVHDPGGELYYQVSDILREYGYDVKVFDSLGSNVTCSYNPIKYISDEADVHCIAECILQKLEAEDVFWRKSQELFLCACIYYLKNHCKEESRKNLNSILSIIKTTNGKRELLEELFENLPKESKAYQYYKAFSQASGLTYNHIIADLLIRFSRLFDEKVAALVTTDTLELEKLNKEKTVIFIVTSAKDLIHNSLLFTTMLISQAYNVLANSNTENKIPVTFILNEFEALGKIPNIGMNMCVGRKFKLSYITICMNLDLLNSVYGKDTNQIIGNSSTLIHLGNANDVTTTEFFEKVIDKSDDYFKQSFRKMNQNNCLVACTNHKPMIDKKYDLRKHPLYYKILEYNK